MTKSLTYKGYTARVEFDAEDRIFFGRLAGIADVVTFHSESAAELVQAFEGAVDGYLAMSEQLGRAPQTPPTRRITVHVPPDIHARATALAQVEGKSLDAWAQEVLVYAVSRPAPVSATERRPAAQN
jgi:predicted HicB family RNase H-like nuclease